MKRKFFALTLCLLCLLTACGGPAYSAEVLSSGGRKAPSEEIDLTGPGAQAATDFAVELLQSTDDGGNVLLSPVSVLCALAMTANGAAGETKSQMEDALGLPVEDLNVYLQAYSDALPEDKEARCSLANSVWFRDAGERLTMEQTFLDTCADYYGADLFRAPFDDSTLKDLNTWVSDRTDGLIPSILGDIPDSAMVYLVNALAFDGRWEAVYRENQIHEGTFTAEDGSQQSAQLMYSQEDTFLEDDLATGFLKYYEGETYAFAALLPNEGVSLEDYIASLTGEGLRDTLTSAREEAVETAIPQFTVQFDTELSAALAELGMADAFNASQADFSAMGSSPDGPLYISRVLHKTFLALDAQGTRAGAATVVEVDTGSDNSPGRTVYLDRPFLYLLVDCEANLPLFIGVVRSLEN